MRRIRWSQWSGGMMMWLMACGSSPTNNTPPLPPPPEAQPGCNPVIGDDCLTPYPSAFWEKADTTSATGYRVNLPATGALPVQSTGVPLKPDRLNQKDGFSPATPFFAYFKGGVDPTPLFGWLDPSKSLKADSPVQVIDYETGERLVSFAELDDNVNGDGQRQALIVHPLIRLTPGKRYVIALLGLNDTKGQPLVPAPFKALRDGTTLSKSLTPLKSRYDEIFASLTKAGVDRSKLTLAWDVVIASDDTATGHLIAMRDTALAMADKGDLSYKIVSTTPGTDPHMSKLIAATVQVPSFLVDDSGKSMMNFGPDGKPAVRAVVDVPITITIPKCAETAPGPIPLVVFGHGLFGNAKDTMSSGPAQAASDNLCKVFVGTDWIGLSSNDISNLKDLLTVDLNNFYVISDRLQQAHVNAHTMTRLMLKKIKDDPAMTVNGHQAIDGSEVYYFGVSLGGIQGTTFMGLNTDVVRGTLNVPGCEWSLLIPRSSDFAQFSGLLGLLLPDTMDRQLGIVFTQSEWDYTDAATYAPHLIKNSLPGTPLKHVLVQESIGDAQVANVATRVLARTAGLPGLDLTDPVLGVTAGTAPLDSAYTQYNSHKTPFPPMDDTALPKDNGAHDSVWASPKALQQIAAFAKPDGKVIDVCGGTKCDLP